MGIKLQMREVCNINIDLMFGLPLQTLERWGEDLKIAAESEARCVTTYPLYTRPRCEMDGFSSSMFPSGEDNLLMAVMAREFFTGLGYKPGPVHFFAKPGVVSQEQNMKKWEGSEEVVGLGPYIYQFANNTDYRNFFDMRDYKDSILSGRLPIWMGRQLDQHEQMARMMVLGMKSGKVDKKLFEKKFQFKPEDVFPEKIAGLKDLGLIEITDDWIILTRIGELYSEEAAIKFYSDEVKHAVENSGAKYAGYIIT